MNGETPGTLRAVLEAGVVFWGLFAAFGAITAAYVVWLVRAEGAEEQPPAPAAGAGGGEGARPGRIREREEPASGREGGGAA